MAEVHIFGNILKAVDFEEVKLLCKWSIQAGSSWEIIEGESEGQTVVSADRVSQSSTFAHPIDIHFLTRSIQDWPKIHVEIFAVNALKNSWPVGFGFFHIPTKAGYHKLEINTWKIVPSGVINILENRFWSGGFILNKTDLVFSGLERYKLLTASSGKIIIEISIIFRNFGKFGIEYK